MQTAQGGTDGQTGEAGLGDGCVDDTLLAEAVQEVLGDLVCAIILGNLLAQDEDLVVLLELLGKRLVQGIADCVLLDAGGVGICPSLYAGDDGGPGEEWRCGGRTEGGGPRRGSKASRWSEITRHDLFFDGEKKGIHRGTKSQEGRAGFEC